MSKRIEYTARAEDEGMSLGKVLQERLSLTVRQIRKIKFTPEGLKLNGAREAGGRLVTTRTVIHENDVITAFFQDEGPSVEMGEIDEVSGLKPEILYEDEDLVFLNKPSGLVCHPAHGHFTDTLVNYLAARYHEPARLIGRLDKETSGVIVAAKNTVASTRLEAERKRGILSRDYLALVHGKLEGSGLCDIPLKRVKSETLTGGHGKALSVMAPAASEDEEGALRALTEWKAVKYCEDRGSFGGSFSGSFGGTFGGVTGGVTLVQLHLLTGRTHQIRAHMAAMGHPLLGDGLYGVEDAAPRCMLHSVRVSLVHPFTGKELSIPAPLPEDFAAIIQAMKKES
ncbi:MAG: RluA family pseudouridine synthase [Firmicutes bacterium]|nr:RluA family pseudouridine synthase [Bacillota bacterium]